MLNIAVVDDEQVHRDILTKYISEWKETNFPDMNIEHYDSAEAFYFAWCGDQSCDIVFLDIVMGKTNGVSLARKLREKGKDMAIVFTTGIPDYMQEGYEVEAMHYLLKPLKREKVWECLEKCFQRKETERKRFLLPGEEGLVKVDVERILYAEAEGHYCVLKCMENRLHLKLGIRELEQKLGECGDFMFCHRSYLVNVRRIARVGRQDIVMDDGTVVPVSRRLYNAVNERFIKTFIAL